jgi:hypothetical protein
MIKLIEFFKRNFFYTHFLCVQSSVHSKGSGHSLLGRGWAGQRATMDYFEEPEEWRDKAEASDASIELVMLLAKNMTRVMDLFRKVSPRRLLMTACSSAAPRLRLCSASQWDTNNDGKISKKEFKRGMVALGFQARPPPHKPPATASPSLRLACTLRTFAAGDTRRGVGSVRVHGSRRFGHARLW